jgi:hypothetical protein
MVPLPVSWGWRRSTGAAASSGDDQELVPITLACAFSECYIFTVRVSQTRGGRVTVWDLGQGEAREERVSEHLTMAGHHWDTETVCLHASQSFDTHAYHFCKIALSRWGATPSPQRLPAEGGDQDPSLGPGEAASPPVPRGATAWSDLILCPTEEAEMVSRCSRSPTGAATDVWCSRPAVPDVGPEGSGGSAQLPGAPGAQLR